MTIQLHVLLKEREKENALPRVTAFNRIDGPGSSQDLREFQQTFWRIPSIPCRDDPSRIWTSNLPRTVGITIDTGTRIEARPFDPERIAVKSVDYQTLVTGFPGEIKPIKENWLLKIMEIFNLKGVLFVLKNIREGIHSSGLGGSSTATMGVCILANELIGRPFSKFQLISLASRIEQDMGVSITGTQEQSNVMYGGVTDYVWFPWGKPGIADSGYGQSLRYELLPPEDYTLLEKRMAIFHTGKPRFSSEVNLAWRKALLTDEGYKLHSQKMEVAYQYREALRLKKWDHLLASIEKYRKIRTKLCSEYMEGSWDLLERAKSYKSTAFPLGAGGGGGVLLFSPKAESIEKLQEELKNIYQEIPFNIRSRGHELKDMPLKSDLHY
ncbi:MAG: GHMP kinase [Methanobacteriaceae archaeon]|nr:GHMP kinase [Methanobacteriaceae archaeon]